MKTDNPQVRQMIGRSFVGAYEVVIWIAVGLALASSVTAASMIRWAQRATSKLNPLKPGSGGRR